MTDKINDGGPAFPMTGEGYGDPRYSQYGMTLRDWFAGMVLQASCQDAGPWEAARLAYKYADAMVEARNKEKTE